MNRLIALTGILLFGAAVGHAQTNQDVAAIMQTIYKNYDNIPYASFDVQFHYSSDTLLGKFQDEHMDGSFTMAGKKAKYRLGEIDFMQNDSLSIVIYHKDKLILVDEPKTLNAGNQLPLRPLIDTLLNTYAADYVITMGDVTPDTGFIQLTGKNDQVQFEKVMLTYDNRDKRLYSINYEFTELAELDEASLAILRAQMNDPNYIPKQKKRFTVRFSNYRFDNFDDSVYEPNSYVWFENGVCKPVPAYEAYQVYNSKPPVRYHEHIEEGRLKPGEGHSPGGGRK